MKNNKFFMAAIAASVASFVLGFLVYGIGGLDAFMQSHSGLTAEGQALVNKPMEEMNWLSLILSTLTGGFLIAIILLWGNITTAAGGAKAGAIVGLLMCASWDFGFFAFTNLHTMTSLTVDIIAGTIMTAITGAVAGWVLGKGATSAA